MVEEQGLAPEATLAAGIHGNNNYRLGSTYFANSTCLTLLHNNFDQPQDISPKDITVSALMKPGSFAFIQFFCFIVFLLDHHEHISTMKLGITPRFT